jgi:hypothetical protein
MVEKAVWRQGKIFSRPSHLTNDKETGKNPLPSAAAPVAALP